jgi:hypothetical protein
MPTINLTAPKGKARKKPTRSEVKTAINLARELDVLTRQIGNHFRRDCFVEHLGSALLDLDGFAENLLCIIVEAVAPQNLDDARKMPSPLRPFAVTEVLYTLDHTTTVNDDGAPEVPCMDGYADLLDLPGNVDAVLADMSLHTADDLLAWLEAHTPEGFWSEEF